jgi:carbon-monoxide dehydrogenase medium subunit
MKPSPFEYHRPESINDAVTLLAKYENARLLAGGQTLVPMLNMRVMSVDHLIDINRIPELCEISITGKGVRIGAMARQATLLDHPELAHRMPILREALLYVGHIPTRNRGTIGGSLAHLDPSAELPGIAALHDAVVVVRSTRGERRIAMADFPRDYLTPDISSDEMLVAVEIPLWPQRHGWGFLEFAHRHGDFAVVSAAVLLLTDAATATVSRAAIVLTGIAEGPVRLTEAEALLQDATLDEQTWRAAAACTEVLSPLSDHMASAAYRKRLARTLTERVLRKAAERANGRETLS